MSTTSLFVIFYLSTILFFLGIDLGYYLSQRAGYKKIAYYLGLNLLCAILIYLGFKFNFLLLAFIIFRILNYLLMGYLINDEIKYLKCSLLGLFDLFLYLYYILYTYFILIVNNLMIHWTLLFIFVFLIHIIFRFYLLSRFFNFEIKLNKNKKTDDNKKENKNKLNSKEKIIKEIKKDKE